MGLQQGCSWGFWKKSRGVKHPVPPGCVGVPAAQWFSGVGMLPEKLVTLGVI